MLVWIAPFVGAACFLAYRSWSQDVAIRSGELMDVRDVYGDGLPGDGDVDLEVRVLADRLYRIELQLEAWIAANKATDEFPCRLVITKADADAQGEVVYAGDFTLGERAKFLAGRAPSPEGGVLVWGCLPLLEFRCRSLVRLRFELSLPSEDRRERGPVGRMTKASVVVKEEARGLRARRGTLERIEIPSFLA